MGIAYRSVVIAARCIPLVLTVCLGGIAHAETNSLNSDTMTDRRLTGVWRVDSAIRFNIKNEIGGVTLRFRGSTLTMFDPKGKKESTPVTVRPTASPSEIDFVLVDEDNTKLIVQGIYKCDGDELTICLSDAVAPEDVDAIICTPMGPVFSSRPTDFDDAKGTLMKCTRIAKTECP